ncbi:aminoacylase-1-like isoform X1 [Eriocheir sinensis]|uniref:aminoacylase-1-like isoform X1 n=1 Tax=Eriocheir sinensis TaxID=95602 RepID=UPI0021C8FCDD|nr:aminoacylase-1-like isoform X1 [Eriocheir sinensis]XP_050695196.1 aminoacylase-1-like isoform X1 [Eriocheir sinensis]
MTENEHPAVTNFREYIRIRTVQPNPDYGAVSSAGLGSNPSSGSRSVCSSPNCSSSPSCWLINEYLGKPGEATCTEFLEHQGRELGAKVQVLECVPGRPIVIMTLEGQDPALPSLLLNSHTDVVPVFPEHWKHEPFSAHKDEEGNIYGRGTQDMKSVAMQYLEALKQLKKDGQTFLRTIHLTFVPDEETDGKGTQALLKMDYFKKMNVGFALDEGYASTSENFLVFYGERHSWYVYVRCSGQPGHGSQFLPNTAGEKLLRVINSFLSFRDKEERRMKDNPDLPLGHVTTLNLTMLEGGVQFSVVPAQLSVGFDIRIPPMVDVVEFENMLRGWCRDAGEGVVLEIVDSATATNMTCVEDGQSPWWDAFSQACKKEKITIHKEIFPACTDSRFLRELGIPALGFSPMNNTPRLLHDHNEFISEKVFLQGIQIYVSIISALANVKAEHVVLVGV